MKLQRRTFAKLRLVSVLCFSLKTVCILISKLVIVVQMCQKQSMCIYCMYQIERNLVILFLLFLNMFVTGCKHAELKPVLKALFHTDNFRIETVDDADTVELCGALKVNFLCRFISFNFYLFFFQDLI
jgi:hypothetical protein